MLSISLSALIYRCPTNFGILFYFETSPLSHGLLRNVYGKFAVIFLLLISSMISLWLKNMLRVTSFNFGGLSCDQEYGLYW